MILTENRVHSLLKSHSNILPANCQIKILPGCEKHDGYISYLYKVTIHYNKLNNCLSSKDSYELVVKLAPEDDHHRQLMNVRILYLSEIYFYTNILPTFQRLSSDVILKIPKYITSVQDSYKEVVVLEDVRQFGYQMRDKRLFFDTEHFKFSFKEFAKLHAFSLALKQRDPRKFKDLLKGLKDIHGGSNCNLNEETNNWYRACLKQIKELFRADSNILTKLEYIENHLENICESLMKGPDDVKVFCHMDCWNNNMLFKYNMDNLNSIYFLDFQYVWITSPAVDFSYIFYVNGQPDDYPRLQEYMLHYYDSLRVNCQLLGVDCEGKYSYLNFVDDLHTYAIYGYLRALIGIPMSLRNKKDIIDMKDVIDQGIEDTSTAFTAATWSTKCAHWMQSLTLTMIENNFI